MLGIDETRRGRPPWCREAAGRWVRFERFEIKFVDLAGEGGLLGQRRDAPARPSWAGSTLAARSGRPRYGLSR